MATRPLGESSFQQYFPIPIHHAKSEGSVENLNPRRRQRRGGCRHGGKLNKEVGKRKRTGSEDRVSGERSQKNGAN